MMAKTEKAEDINQVCQFIRLDGRQPNFYFDSFPDKGSYIVEAEKKMKKSTQKLTTENS